MVITTFAAIVVVVGIGCAIIIQYFSPSAYFSSGILIIKLVPEKVTACERINLSQPPFIILYLDTFL